MSDEVGSLDYFSDKLDAILEEAKGYGITIIAAVACPDPLSGVTTYDYFADAPPHVVLGLNEMQRRQMREQIEDVEV